MPKMTQEYAVKAIKARFVLNDVEDCLCILDIAGQPSETVVRFWGGLRRWEVLYIGMPPVSAGVLFQNLPWIPF